MALAYQIRATRDYLLDLDPPTPEVTHLLEGVRLAEAGQKTEKRSLLWPPLLAYSNWLEQELQLAQALDVVETARGLDDGTAATEQIAALLQRGRVLRLLGRLEEARASYDQGRAKAVAAGDSHSALLGRIGNAIVTRQLGNLSASEKLLRQILLDAEAAADIDAQARAHHDLGAALGYQQRAAEAIPHYYRAFELYEGHDPRLRALSDVAQALKQLGYHEAAHNAFLSVLSLGPSAQVAVRTKLELLEVSARKADRMAFHRWRRAIVDAGELPPQTQIEFDLGLALGYGTFGQPAKAEQCLMHAVRLAEQHHLNEQLFRAENALAELRNGRQTTQTQETPAATEWQGHPGVANVAKKLEALRPAR
jgi:tetratricopeptide (TPR) repeat protein